MHGIADAKRVVLALAGGAAHHDVTRPDRIVSGSRDGGGAPSGALGDHVGENGCRGIRLVLDHDAGGRRQRQGSGRFRDGRGQRNEW